MPDTSEALKIWQALRPMIDKEIAEQTENCVRAKKMIVKQATVQNDDGSVSLGVAEPYNDKVMIPSGDELSNVNPGSPVWVYWYFNDASTMHAALNGDGTHGSAVTDRLTKIINKAIVTLGPSTASGGQITIPYTTLGGNSGSVNFNIADTQFFIDSVAAARPHSLSSIILGSGDIGTSTQPMTVFCLDDEEYDLNTTVDASAVYNAGMSAGGGSVTQDGPITLNNSSTPTYYPSTQAISVAVIGTLTNGNPIGGTVLITGEAVQDAYNAGWNAALDAAQAHTCYTGTVRQLYDDSLDVYVNAINPYQQHTYYSLPDRK